MAFVFSSSSLTESLYMSRVSKLTLTMEEHEGFKIPTSALAENKGVFGVYILKGFEVQFREISVIYRKDNMMIAEVSPENKSGLFRLLAENDNIIIKIFMTEKSSKAYLDILSENLPRIRNEVAERSGGKATLLAATKTVPLDVINEAIDRYGLCCIGENRVQELLDKYDGLHKENLEIHFIGRLQTNKVKYIIDKVSLIHSVDSEKLACEIDRQAKKHGLVMDVLIEVNVGREVSKGGILPEELADFLDLLGQYPRIRPVGLMAIPPADATKEETRNYFQQTYEIFVDILQKKLHNIDKYILSMGMSDSYKEALDCGANLVRIGSALFGKRTYPQKEEVVSSSFPKTIEK